MYMDIKLLNEGTKFKRESWKNIEYIVHPIKTDSKCTIKYNDGSFDIMELDAEDLLADDWEVVKDIPEIKLKNGVSDVKCNCGYHFGVSSTLKTDYTINCFWCGKEYKVIVEKDEPIDYSKFLTLLPTGVKVVFSYRDAVKVTDEKSKAEKVIEQTKQWLLRVITDYKCEINYCKNHGQLEKLDDFQKSLNKYQYCYDKIRQFELEEEVKSTD